MKIQKPSVLDAARLAAELNHFKRAIIEQAVVDNSLTCLYLTLKNPNLMLKFMVEKRYAYLGLTSDIPKDHEKAVRAVAGYSITSASQLGNDRIVELRLEREDRLGRTLSAELVIELIPNKGDASLVDNDRNIKWSLKKKSGEYIPLPKLKKATVLNFEPEKILSEVDKPEQLADALYGLNERDILNQKFENYKGIDTAIESLKAYVDKARKIGPGWVILKNDQAVGYSLLSPVLLPGEALKQYNSALEMYEAYYSRAAGQETEQDRMESLQRILEKEIARERSKLSSIQRELVNAETAGKLRRYGEIILINVDSIKKGTKIAHLSNFDAAEYLDIELDPAKSAAANAEDYFKRARKAASSVNILTSRLESTKNKLAQLETAAGKKDDISIFEWELIKLNLLSLKPGPARKKPVERRLPYKRFRSSSGWEIWVGRTNKDNDELTFKIAHKDDYWFHAWQAAGSHTVLRPPDKMAVPDKQTLLEASALAAYFSKARTSSKVPVAYTQVKFVHKPRNFPPGKVLVEKEKQLIVRPANPDQFMIKDEE